MQGGVILALLLSTCAQDAELYGQDPFVPSDRASNALGTVCWSGRVAGLTLSVNPGRGNAGWSTCPVTLLPFRA